MLNLKVDNISAYLDVDDEDIVVNNLIDKYNLSSQNESFLDGTKDEYFILIKYIISLYLEKKEIPSDIVEIQKNNHTFKLFLLQEIKNRMNKMLHDSSTIVFKELVTIVNLLSFGKDYEIFTTYNLYSIENISKLFRYYEDYLSNLELSNKEDFELTFNYYITLIETFNELCILNQTDVLRKKTIKGITEALTETINIIKYKLSLNDEKINTLNNILGKLLFYYAHIPFIEITNKELKYIIDEYNFLLEKLTDGYNLSKNTNFGNTSEINKKHYYLIYINSVSTLLLTLFYKLESKFEFKDDFYDLQKFTQIIEYYNENCTHIKAVDFSSLHEFKQHILNNYTYIYNSSVENTDISDYNQIIEELIKHKSMSSESMHMIRNIILYSNNINPKTLIQLLEILLEMPKIKNDYFEFFKLNIIDIIIIKFTNKDTYTLDKKYIKLISDYIEKNKVASHLMSMYSKVYLSIALYYSYSFDLEEHELSKDYYYGYIHINGYEQLENEYKIIDENILLNYGKMEIYDLEIDDINLSREKYISIGRKLASKYNKFKEINLKYEINQNLSNIITHLFTDEGLDNDTLNHQIEYFISNKIFYGLVFSSVEGLCVMNCRLDDVGYEKIKIDLIDGYQLKFAYSNVYKHTFEQIYSKNKEYIKQNVINILISHIKSIPLYIDSITQLDNRNKLEKDLALKDSDDLIFIEIYLDSLIQINETTTFDKANKFFKLIADKLNLEVKTYRTHGPRLGILLDSQSDYKNIVNKIRDLSVNFENEEINILSTIAVSWGNSMNILEKSQHSLILALKSKDKYYEFK